MSVVQKSVQVMKNKLLFIWVSVINPAFHELFEHGYWDLDTSVHMDLWAGLITYITSQSEVNF